MKILLVDDNKNFIKLLKIALQDEDYEVDTAYSGRDALDAMAQGCYDWLVSDIRMDDLDGITLAKQVRHDYPQTRIILMTAFEPPDQAEPLEFEGLIEKPVRIEDLCTIMNSYST